MLVKYSSFLVLEGDMNQWEMFVFSPDFGVLLLIFLPSLIIHFLACFFIKLNRPEVDFVSVPLLVARDGFWLGRVYIVSFQVAVFVLVMFLWVSVDLLVLKLL